jgi:hypothetical protein
MRFWLHAWTITDENLAGAVCNSNPSLLDYEFSTHRLVGETD